MEIKETFDALKEKATDLAQAGVAQTRRLAEIAKLKMANISEEENLKKAYLEIGKLYYAEKGAAPEGAFAAACEKVTAANAAIEANNDRIAELREPGDEDLEAAAEEAGEAVQEAAEAAQEAVQETGEAVEKAAEEIKDTVDDF